VLASNVALTANVNNCRIVIHRGPCRSMSRQPDRAARVPEGSGPYDAVMGGPCVRNVGTDTICLTAPRNRDPLWPLRLIIESWF
jgi:hypothetical protein